MDVLVWRSKSIVTGLWGEEDGSCAACGPASAAIPKTCAEVLIKQMILKLHMFAHNFIKTFHFVRAPVCTQYAWCLAPFGATLTGGSLMGALMGGAPAEFFGDNRWGCDCGAVCLGAAGRRKAHPFRQASTHPGASRFQKMEKPGLRKDQFKCNCDQSSDLN